MFNISKHVKANRSERKGSEKWITLIKQDNWCHDSTLTCTFVVFQLQFPSLEFCVVALLTALVSHSWLWFFFSFFFFFLVYGFGFLIYVFFFPFRLLFQTSLSWWLKKPSWRLTPAKWVVHQYFSCPLCIHHDGSLNHYDKDKAGPRAGKTQSHQRVTR